MMDGIFGGHGSHGADGTGGIDGTGIGGGAGPAAACGLGDLAAIDPFEAGMASAAGAEGMAGTIGADGAVSAAGVAGTAGATGDGMILRIGGEYFDIGPVSADADGDGVADSVTLADDRGLSIYSDIDGDGAVDHVTTVLFDGTYETWTVASGTGAESSGGTPSGVGADPVAKPGGPATWGVHEWERGERGRWA